MTKVSILCWQEIPSLVEAKDKASTHKLELSFRFQELIDLIAMKRGMGGGDAYLMAWEKTRNPDRDDAAEPAATAVAAEIEARYDEIRAQALANS